MRVAVIGAGAIGGLLAAAAADAGHEVHLRVRTPIDELVILRDEVQTTVAVEISVEPRGPVADVVFLVVKARDTASAAPHLESLCGPETLTVVVQNGLDQDQRAAPYLPSGAGPVCPALAYAAAERVAPGKIRHISGNLLIVPAEHADRAASAVGPGVRVRGTHDFRTESWRKLLANLVGNPISALTLRHLDVMRSPGIPELARGLLVEAGTVARADGAELSEVEVLEVLAGMKRFGAETGSSMLHDRLAGRPMEHQYLTGEVVRRGAGHGIDVPLNAGVLALLEAIDQGGSGSGVA